MKSGQQARLLQAFEQIPEWAYAGMPKARLVLGRIHETQGRHEKARLEYTAALHGATSPTGDVRSLLSQYLVHLEMHQGRYREVVEASPNGNRGPKHWEARGVPTDRRDMLSGPPTTGRAGAETARRSIREGLRR